MAGSDSTRSGAMATGGPGGVQNEASGNRKRHLVEKYEKKKKKKKKKFCNYFFICFATGSDSTRSGAMATGGPGGVQNEAAGNRKRHLVEKYENMPGHDVKMKKARVPPG